MISGKLRAILVVIAVCGTLDILSAFAFGAMAGATPGRILRYVASGPFGDAMQVGGAGAATIGLAVHYGLMAIMALIAFIIVGRVAAAREHWLMFGILYGIAIYLVMSRIVVPIRFDSVPRTDLWSVGNALFSHIVCVGVPMAFLAARAFRPSHWEQSTP